MKNLHLFSLLALASLILSACGASQPSPTSAPTSAPVVPPPPENTAVPPGPTALITSGWSSTASTRTELSFAFPGEWDGSSPLTFGEGEFVKDPDAPLGVTFQIELQGDPAALLSAWGTNDIGIVGIVTFTAESISAGPNVTIARLETPTRIAQGNGITAQVAYIQRADDVLEVMWFAPTEQWDALQPVFQGLLGEVEIWQEYGDNAIGLQTMYVHDWLAPQPTWQDTGLWFRSADEHTGLAIFVINEIADPVQMLEAWGVDRLAPLGFNDCTLGEGDRMDAMSGQWESKMGQCTNANGEKVTYEVSFVPNRDRLLELIAYAPSAAWEDAQEASFGHLLGMLLDIRR